MSNLQKYSVKDVMGGQSVLRSFEKVLGDKAKGFVTSVLQIISDSDKLAKASPDSVLNAAMTAATLDLPINPNLGFAYIIPYNNKTGTIAQFQMGYKGYIQLCQRTGLFKTISCTAIYEGQLVNEDPLRGFEFDFRVKSSDKIIGYASFFSLLNGFEKTFYMSKEEVEAHAKEYSQSYRSGYGVWKDNFSAMAKKTVLKLLLSKYAPMSVDIEKAITADQAEILDPNNLSARYPDNDKPSTEKKKVDTEPKEEVKNESEKANSGAGDSSPNGPVDVQYHEEEESLGQGGFKGVDMSDFDSNKSMFEEG